MKIYTRTGDKGSTALFGGERVPKHHIRIETYGTVDELNSFAGLLHDQPECQELREDLEYIQQNLFTLGSHLAAQPGKKNLWLPDFAENEVIWLEERIDKMDASLPELKNFILPGGNQASSYAHVCRCVCRRAERLTVLLAETDEIEPVIITYLNRLSDYFFTLARFISWKNGAEEIPWKPRQ